MEPINAKVKKVIKRKMLGGRFFSVMSNQQFLSSPYNHIALFFKHNMYHDGSTTPVLPSLEHIRPLV